MNTVQIIQGSPEWHAHRATHFNASDAPAMLGFSPYKTRSQLIHEMATGAVQEHDAATQRRFDDGHRFEALARPLAEKIIGKDLYPVVGTLGKYSASFDGLDMMEEDAFEHKSLNDSLRASIRQQGGNANDFLAPAYRVQMEQQLMVSGANRVLFMASKWDGETLVEERHCWYTPDLELRAKIVAGWEQFEKDVAAYVPAEAAAPVVAAPQLGLPAVSIQVNGSIALVDNLDKFGLALKAYVEGINKKPETDQDFADLESSVKTLKSAEEALDAAESGALAQTDSIDAMRKTVALYRDLARTNRLLIEKLVKAEKENRRTAIVSEAVAELITHVHKCNDRIGRAYMPSITGDFAGVVKGLKSLDSMKDKVATELARCKIAANEYADLIQLNLGTDGLEEYSTLFADIATLCLKQPEDFKNTVTARISQHQAKEAARLESEREKIRAEEQAKAQREAARQQEQERQFAEQETAEIARLEKANKTLIVEAAPAVAPVANVIPMTRQASTPPTLKLGDIAERLGFTLTADFLTNLGFDATRVKGACLYQERDFPLMLMRLVSHIQHVQAQQAA